jgi:hypothetical protein
MLPSFPMAGAVGKEETTATAWSVAMDSTASFKAERVGRAVLVAVAMEAMEALQWRNPQVPGRMRPPISIAVAAAVAALRAGCSCRLKAAARVRQI